MTKQEEAQLSDLTYNQWKNHDCTKALINSLNDSLKVAEQTMIQHVKSSTDISIQILNCHKGALRELFSMLHLIDSKDSLEKFINQPEEKNE